MGDVMSCLGIVLIMACLITDMATPLWPGAFRLDPAESIHGVWPRTHTALAVPLSAPSLPEHDAQRAESRSGTFRRPVASARPPFRCVLPRAALVSAGVDPCLSPSPEDG
jgi:hypothetical protein